MRIKCIRLRNFLSFGDTETVLDHLHSVNLLVGPNGSGKSNFLRAVEYVGDALSGNAPPLRSLVHRGNDRGEEYIEVDVELSDEERDAAIACIVLGLANQAAAHGGDMLLVRKVATVLSHCDEMFRPIFSGPVTFTVRSLSNQEQEGDRYLQLHSSAGPVFLLSYHSLSLGGLPTPQHVRGYMRLDLEGEVSKMIKQKFPERCTGDRAGQSLTPEEVSELASPLDVAWLVRELTPTHGYMKSLGLGTAMPTHWDEASLGPPTSSFLDLVKFLESMGPLPKQVAPFELLTRIYHSSVVRLSDTRLKLVQSDRLSADQSSYSLGGVSGFSLAEDLFRIKNSPNLQARKAYAHLQEAFRDLSGISFDVVEEEFETSASTGEDRRPIKLPSIFFDDGTFTYGTDNAAAGHCELLLVLTCVVNGVSTVALLDEPALNLHPVKQRELYSQLVSLANRMSNQLFIITHSPSFLGLAETAGAMRFTLSGGATHIHRVVGLSMELMEEIQSMLRVEPGLASLLFSNKVILVEGQGEEAAFSEWFPKCVDPVDLSSRGVTIFNVNGDGSFKRFAEFLDLWEIPFRAVGDGKAAAKLDFLRTHGYSYPEPDLRDILTSPDYKQFYDEAFSTWNNTPKNPLVCRLVAQRTTPPPSVEAIWKFLRSFVNGDE
ncbi:MAG: AAA family ATPase [Nitrososphaerota archaeon]|jgi:hypothetical protein|nr:AAA family ATPase [Nitrososphaerota archaeon]